MVRLATFCMLTAYALLNREFDIVPEDHVVLTVDTYDDTLETFVLPLIQLVVPSMVEYLMYHVPTWL